MNKIQVFKNSQFGEVRVAEIDGKTYFVGSDVAKALGYAIPHKAISTHCKGVLKWNILTNGGNQEMLVISEGDIYRLIVKSQLPEAEIFESWIFDEILPAIRKTGGYIAAAAEETPEEIMARALLVAQSTLDRVKQQNQILQGENEHLTNEVKVLAPKAEYTDKVLQSTSTYTFTQVAKELGMSVYAFEKKLHENEIFFKQSGQWLPYVKYQDKGYHKFRTHHFTYSDGSPGTNTITVFTERGRELIHNLMQKGGAL